MVKVPLKKTFIDSKMSNLNIYPSMIIFFAKFLNLVPYLLGSKTEKLVSFNFLMYPTNSLANFSPFYSKLNGPKKSIIAKLNIYLLSLLGIILEHFLLLIKSSFLYL